MARGKYKGPKRGAGQRLRGQSASGPTQEQEDAFREEAAARAAARRNAVEQESSSSEEEEEETGAKPSINVFGQMGAPGEMPPSSSDDDNDDSDEESSSDESDAQPPPRKPAAAAAAAAPPPRRKKDADDDVDPAQAAKDMERLQLIKQKREEDRQKRIAEEGWDRYAPVTEANKPPDARPSDHPDFKQ